MTYAIRSHTCKWCGKTFERPRKTANACSLSCRGKISAAAKGNIAWRKEENDRLEMLSGTMPIELLVKRLASFNKRRGWEPRTESAVKCQAKRLGVSIKSTIDNFSSNGLCRELGISTATISTWKKFGFPDRIAGGRRCAISRSDFKKWAKQNPNLLAGVDVERLAWVLDDAKLANQIASAKPNRAGKRIQIRRLDTHQIYSSIGQAVKAPGVFISASGLTTAVQRRKSDRVFAGGIEWEVVRNEL